MNFKKLLLAIALTSSAIAFLVGCASDKFNLGDGPSSSKVYKFLDTSRIYSMDPQPGNPMNPKFTPSLLNTLDYKLSPELNIETEPKAVKILHFSVAWIDPNVSQEKGVVVAGALLAGPIGIVAATVITAPKERHDTLRCYFNGEYRGKHIEVEKVASCPEKASYCFGTSSMNIFDATLPSTKEAAQKLASECIADITVAVRNIKESSSKNVSL
jgi:hypothetical protein